MVLRGEKRVSGIWGGAKLTGLAMDFGTSSIRVYLEGEHFGRVGEGERLPQIPVFIKERRRMYMLVEHAEEPDPGLNQQPYDGLKESERR
jgi:hypothetical protein